MEEGYIKFSCHWDKQDFIKQEHISEINQWRKALWDIQLIGTYPNGIGYGNISERWQGNQFIISGTNTGKIENLTNHEYALVINYSIDLNSVGCKGMTIASSESLTHAAIYEASEKINSVIHIHHSLFWEYLLKSGLKSPAAISYGTPEMAYALKNIVSKRPNDVNLLIAMEGHQDGIIACGKNAEDAFLYLLQKFNSFMEIRKY